MRQVLIVLLPILALTCVCLAQEMKTMSAESWQPMAGSPPAERATADGRDAVRLPIKLAGNDIPRASWDCEVNLDLALASGLQFQVLSTDASPVAGFSIYLQSGNGWYRGTFAPTSDGKWSTVQLRKEDTGMEGTPAGWGKVRTIRISAWRGLDQDTELYVRGFEPIAANPSIAIIRGESIAELRPAERETVDRTTNQVADMLGELGLPYVMVSDRDLNSDVLAKIKLAILPHNPAMAEPSLKALTQWLQTDGRLMGFYGMPGELLAACGIQPGQHVRQTRPGHFATIAPDVSVLPDAPNATQRSWNILDAKPANERVKVAARWLDDAGQPTGNAILASDRAIYMTHILLPDGAASKRELLAAMLAKLLPESRQMSAQAAIDKIGRLAGARDLDALAKNLTGTRGATLLQQAITQRAQAVDLLAKGNPVEATRVAGSAQANSIKAWCMAQEPQASEFRGFWSHRPFGIEGMSWDDSLKLLADNGFNAIVPNMLWGGSAAYPSKVLPAASNSDGKDHIAECLAAARKHGLQVHVWKVNWNMGWSSPKEFIDRMKREGRTQVGFDGKADEPWLCPSHPLNQQLEIDSMVEVAEKYEVDGIHFDYIRYPDQDHCFCPGCKERFEKVIGETIANWPGDVRKDKSLLAKWNDFRREHITKVVAEVSRQARQKRPGIKISAAVFRTWPTDRDTVGQDWKLWCDRGYMDFVCPMDYTPYNAQFDAMIASQKTWAGRVPVYPGIGLSTWSTQDPVKLIEQIQITRKHNTNGFIIFEYNAPEADQIVPLLGLGATRP